MHSVYINNSLHSSGVEHWSRKRGVVSSILTGGYRKREFYVQESRCKKITSISTTIAIMYQSLTQMPSRQGVFLLEILTQFHKTSFYSCSVMVHSLNPFD